MIGLAASLGFVAACLLHRIADYLPRWVGRDAVPKRPGWRPALLVLLRPASEQQQVSGWILADAALELSLPLAFTWLSSRLDSVPALLGTLLALLYFVLVALIDLRHRLVLNLLTYPALLIALLVTFNPGRLPLRAALLGGGLAFAIFFLTSLLRPGTLGGGDIKLAALIGLWLGFPNLLYALLIAGGLGAAAALALLLHGANLRQQSIAYAPFLCTGALICILGGALSLRVPLL